MIQYNLRIPAFEATPKNVRMLDASAPIVTKASTRYAVYLLNGLPAGTGGGSYPVVGHVRSPDKYGPTGVEYTGTEVLPAEADVKTGVGFGENGTEFTGTLVGGSAKRRIRGIW